MDYIDTNEKMMKLKTKNNNSLRKKEALFNECKGFLFEYLVASEIALDCGQRSQFFCDLPRSLHLRLVQYEQLLRFERPELLHFLGISSKCLADKILQFTEGKGKKIFLTGKKQRKNFSEEDLEYVTSQKSYFLSLKFYKENQGINTKSGGVFSFLESYFLFQDDLDNEKISIFQKQLNDFTHLNYIKFCQEMIYEMNEKSNSFLNIDTDTNTNNIELLLKTYLKKYHLSELPGELPSNFKAIIYSYYSNLNEEIFKIFNQLYSMNSLQFKQAIMRLCGFSNENEYQCQLIYFKKKITTSCEQSLMPYEKINFSEVYKIKEMSIIKYNDIFDHLSDIEIIKTSKRSYFDIVFGKYVLSIRVKPMNKFTTKGVKINCSIKIT